MEIIPTDRYARCILSSKRVHWDIEQDVIRGREFSAADKFLPDGLALPDRFTSLSPEEKRFVSQIQGRTYANIFGLVERYINAKILEVSRDYVLGNQVALEALVGFSQEELKHQNLFRRIDEMMGEVLPDGYRFDFAPDSVARDVLGKSSWAVLLLTLDVELFTQLHYRQSIELDTRLSELFKDVFLFHWKEESQHAVLDELELLRHDAELTPQERDRGVDDFIDLAAALASIVREQAAADARYFAANCRRVVAADEAHAIEAAFLAAYRWQYIYSGVAHPHFRRVLAALTTETQRHRIQTALTGLQ
jgi:hypothetical protein